MPKIPRVSLSSSLLSILLTVLLVVWASDPADAKKRKGKGKEAATEETKDEKDEWDVSNPPGEWQTITIDTDETTWSSLDVSPDGSTILFDMLGDLYTVPITGGEATALTSGIAWDIQPRYSPDGRRIVFVSDRAGGDNLWVMDADGSAPKAVTEEKEHLVHNPSWSPDGEWIVGKKAFTSTRSIGAGEIWLFHHGGGGGLQLTERPNGRRDQKLMAEPTFSPDGRYVYYSQDTTPGVRWQYNKDSTGAIFAIKRLDRETGDIDVVVSGPGGAVRPTPSPDGKIMAFVKRLPGLTSALYLKDMESGKEWAIYDQFERDLQESAGEHGNVPAFAWTPDGAAIVFWSGGKIRRVDTDSRETEVIPVHIRSERKIQPALRFPVEVSPDTVHVRMLRWVRPSPDGSTIAFQALGYIHLRDVGDGGLSEPRRLTTQTDHFEFYPDYSTDGRWIVYTTWDDEELGSVRVVASEGGEGRKLTSRPGRYVEPAFSPDGRHVVYRMFAGGFLTSPLWSVDPGIYLQAVDGGEPVRLSASGSGAHFDARGERVLFTTRDGDKLVLKSVDLEGGDERTHLEGSKLTEMRVSPDGRWVAFTEQYDAYVAAFTLTGRTVSVGPKTSSIPVRRVSKRAGEHLRWSAASDRLTWAQGPILYGRDLADAFAFLDGAPEELPEPVEEGIDVSFEVAADRPNSLIALVGGRVVTMRDADSTREVIDDGVVVVDGHRIRAVGSSSEVTVPEGARIVDVAGKTVLPGYIDVHAHGPHAREELTPQQNWTQYANLAFGVTTIHDPSNDSSSIFSAAEMQRAGLLVSPRIFSTGTILYGAHSPGATARINSFEDARFHVQRLKDLGAISVKSYQQPRRDQRQQIVAAARELGIMVLPEGGMKFMHNMTEIVDGHTGIEHSIPLKTAYADVEQLWSQTEVGYSPTFVVSFGGISGENYWYQHTEVWKDERLMAFTPRFAVEPRAIRRTMAPDDHYNHIPVAEFAKELRDLGVPVLIGAHGQRHGLAAHWEMWIMEQGGFTPWEALRGATIDGARYVGLDGDVGSLEAGKLADLVVIDGDPLSDLRQSKNVMYTMLGGRLYESSTMNQMAPDQVERQEFFFEKEGGDTIHPSAETWLREVAERHHWVH